MSKNIPLFKVFMSETAAPEVAKVLNSGYVGQGPKVEEFEKNLKDFFDVDYLLTINSATSAEHLALHMLKKPQADWPGIEEGDEVLCTPLTCTASNWPVLANNMKIRWVDIDEKTLNMDLDDLERKISPRTKAIMLVHWGGYPNDLDRIKRIQQKCKDLHGFKPAVIEDCAHSIGSRYKGKLIGNHGNLCTFSLQAIKHVTSVDGGVLLLPHKDLYNRGKLLRWYGIDREGDRKDFRCEADVIEWGFKFHMNDVMATVGIENLKHANEIIEKHKSNAAFYDKELQNVSGVTLLERKPGFESSFWIYSMLVENRADFMKHMKDHGIAVSQVHERNDKHTCVKEYRSPLPTLDKTIGSVISIPVGWWVTEEDRQYIVDCIKKGWKI
jgi:dTDP-4-amino-4,6-dideoxygalactose transaminase